MSGPIKSLDVHINWNSAQDTSDGFNIGTITYYSVLTELQPSILAASSSSLGTPRRNCTSINTK